jgi:hypothetical protein
MPKLYEVHLDLQPSGTQIGVVDWHELGEMVAFYGRDRLVIIPLDAEETELVQNASASRG